MFTTKFYEELVGTNPYIAISASWTTPGQWVNLHLCWEGKGVLIGVCGVHTDKGRSSNISTPPHKHPMNTVTVRDKSLRMQ